MASHMVITEWYCLANCGLAELSTLSEKLSAPPGFSTSVCWFEGPQMVLYCHTFLSAYVVLSTETVGRLCLRLQHFLVNHTFNSSSQSFS